MPHKKNIPFPEWISSSDDLCLRSNLEQAWIARLVALDNGVDKNKRCAAAFKSADKTLEQVRFGLAHKPIEVLCKSADDALRKFVEARFECRREKL